MDRNYRNTLIVVTGLAIAAAATIIARHGSAPARVSPAALTLAQASTPTTQPQPRLRTTNTPNARSSTTTQPRSGATSPANRPSPGQRAIQPFPAPTSPTTTPGSTPTRPQGYQPAPLARPNTAAPTPGSIFRDHPGVAPSGSSAPPIGSRPSTNPLNTPGSPFNPRTNPATTPSGVAPSGSQADHIITDIITSSAADDTSVQDSRQLTPEKAEQLLNDLLNSRVENALIETALPNGQSRIRRDNKSNRPIIRKVLYDENKYTAPKHLKREGQFVIARRGQMVRSNSAFAFTPYMFQFEPDENGIQDPPMFLQPCQVLEDMEKLVQSRDSKVTFIVTGQVFVFGSPAKGTPAVNYLLPTNIRLGAIRQRH